MGIDWFGMLFGQGIAVAFGYWCTDFLQVQRVIVAKDLRSAQNGTIIGAALKMMVPLIVTIPGLLGLAVLMNSDGSPMVLVPESDPRAGITHNTFNDVLPLLMGKYLGPGLLGLGVTAMIAGFMSGMAGNVSAFATVWTHDVYKPLINRKGSDRHYLNMGRWSSVVGVLLSIATAYTLFFFSNILEYLQVLVFFFIVPLFGTVILGMLWKRATPAGGFWGFLVAILFSVSMWAYVHTFPHGYQPQPKVTLSHGAEVLLTRANAAKPGAISYISIESGALDLVNVPLFGHEEGGEFTVQDQPLYMREVAPLRKTAAPIQILAPEVVIADTREQQKFGLSAVPARISPGVKVRSTFISRRFDPAAFNPDHVKVIARSDKAKPMAVNMYSAWWSLVVCLLVTIVVSLFTRPKPEAELKNLVMGLTPLPKEEASPWHRKPLFWAAVVMAVFIVINIIFW